MSKTKLELTWIGKDKRPKLEPRILLEAPELSYHASHKVSDNDIFDNKLIFGDNLLALKSLEQDYTGKVKCIYIDPPFNTGEAFENYDDGLEHSIWLGLMYERSKYLHKLLDRDGSLFVHIDDNEMAYLTLILDEIFGRENRINIITFKQGSATGHKAINPGLVTTTNYILVYAKDKRHWLPNRLYTARERDSRYSQYIENFDKDLTEWKLIPLNTAFANVKGMKASNIKKALGASYESEIGEFVLNNADRVIQLARPDYKSVGQNVRDAIDHSTKHPETVLHLERDGYQDMFFLGGRRLLFYKNKLKLIDGKYVAGEPLTNLWGDILSNNLHKEGGIKFPKGKKPEFLIKRVLELCTKEGDLVLDSFAGSGTTAAVAHKLKRRWITIELGDQCHSHILPRLRQTIDGTDQDGVSKAVGWQGGGGFRYYKLAPSLIEYDRFGQPVINKEFNAEMMAEAVCKLEGFTYAPSDFLWWQHGFSTETDFIYVTTQNLSVEQLEKISEEVGTDKTLLVMCGAFRCKADRFVNLTIKKLPKAVLKHCEWAHDDYSLNVDNLPMAESDPEQENLF